MVTNEFIDMLVKVIPETCTRFALKIESENVSSVMVNYIMRHDNTYHFLVKLLISIQRTFSN